MAVNIQAIFHIYKYVASTAVEEITRGIKRRKKNQREEI